VAKRPEEALATTIEKQTGFTKTCNEKLEIATEKI
jgi:hypothetical protein